MKKLIIAFSIFALVSCDKEEINNTDTKVGRSDVTIFPTLTINGARYMTVPINGTWTDPGAVAKEGSSSIQYTVSGTVDTSQPGVYLLTYIASNKDGIPTSQSRTVAVYNTDASAAANDLSGTYLRTATGVNSYWTRLAPGVYKVDNPGGASTGEGLSIIVLNPTGFTIHAPAQRSNDGDMSSTSNEVYTISPAGYSWVFNHSNYGTSSRKFVKQ